MPVLRADEHGRPSPEHDLRVGEVVVERDPRQPLERLDVAGARPRDDVGRQLRPGIGLVPAERSRSSRARTACRRTAAGRPGAYSSAGQKREESGVSASSPSTSRPSGVEAELELRVGEDDPARLGVGRGEAVERERDALDLGVALGADELGRGRDVDVLVVARRAPSSPA